MAKRQAKVSADELAGQWQARLKRFGRGQDSVTAFCKSESVSVPSFYYWRAKLSANVQKRKASAIERFIEVAPTRLDEDGAGAMRGIELQLELGAGIVLRIRRP